MKTRVDKIIETALKEDIGRGDITTQSMFSSSETCLAAIVFKQDGIVCGLDIAEKVFKRLDKTLSFKKLAKDGQFCKSAAEIVLLNGKVRSILKGERVALNFIQHLSGIATLTKRFCDAAKPYGVQIFDTRKTIPGLRELEKYAVRTGGGKNHRMGLGDASIIKSNHLLLRSDLSSSIKDIRKKGAKFIEIEVSSGSQIDEFINLDIDAIMLDNFSPTGLGQVIKMIRKKNRRLTIEVSGGVTLENAREIAKSKPDRISVGRLTHSAPALDVSLRIL